MDEAARRAATDVGPVKIFMSCRRAVDRHFIGRLHDRLYDAYGDEMLSRDIDLNPASTSSATSSLRTLSEVDAVVAIIGRTGLDPRVLPRQLPTPTTCSLEVAEHLRSEEREARARLAELEEAATRHQIEQERARLEAIEDQLRRTESAEQVISPTVVTQHATAQSISAAEAAAISTWTATIASATAARPAR